MLKYDLPGLDGPIEIEHLVLDVNGTIAIDGTIVPGVAEAVAALVDDGVHVVAITADTHGTASAIRESLGIDLKIIESGGERAQKAAYVRWLGAERVAAIGNGANDADMLEVASIGICVMGAEGAAGRAVAGADVLVGDIASAFALLRTPSRLVATLRT